MTVQERIVEHATEMFLRSGIKAITMDQISREAGVSKRTIYECFLDKDDLLRHCLKFMDENYIKEHDAIVQDSPNTIQLVFNLMKLGIRALQHINPLFFEDLKRYHRKVWKDVYKINAEKQKVQTLTMLRKGINQGVLRKEINVEIVTILLMEQLRIIEDNSIFAATRFSQQEVFENVVINFFRGISTVKGLDQIDKILLDEADFFITS